MKVESAKQIIQRRCVQRHIRIVRCRLWIRIVVPASRCQGLQLPVPLNEFHQRNVITVAVTNVAALGKWRNDDQWNPGAVSEKVQRLNVARIVIAAALVEGDKNRRARPHFRIRLYRLYNLLRESLE